MIDVIQVGSFAAMIVFLAWLIVACVVVMQDRSSWYAHLMVDWHYGGSWKRYIAYQLLPPAIGIIVAAIVALFAFHVP